MSRAGLDRSIGDHALDHLNSEIGAHNRQRPVIVFADTAGGNICVLRREVRAVVAALASPAVAFLEIDLVIGAVLHPDLEGAFDVHLHHVLLLEAVFGLEELAEDRVVEGFRAEKTNVELEGFRHFAGLPVPHCRRRRCLATHSHEGETLVASSFRFWECKRVRTIGVATAGGCKNFFAGRNDDRFGLPRIIVFDTRDQSGIDVIMFAKPDKHR